jgi:hypothetical protein
MSAWLQPLRDVLDASPRPVTVFFRDDDAGWDDDGLFALLDRFEHHALPVDLAAIPTWMTAGLARELTRRATRAPGLLGIHQHGYAHANHELEGRRCEFGAQRSRGEQLGDIDDGRRILRRWLGELAAPIFTPPWNRCNADTGACLAELGFAAISRDRSAGTLDQPGLRELAVQVDLLAKRRGERLGPAAIGEQLAERARERQPLGVMLHHGEMGAADVRALDELLALVAVHERARCRPMTALLDAVGAEVAA